MAIAAGTNVDRPMSDEMLLRECEQVLGSGICVGNASRAIEQQHRGGEQIEAGKRAFDLVTGELQKMREAHDGDGNDPWWRAELQRLR